MGLDTAFFFQICNQPLFNVTLDKDKYEGKIVTGQMKNDRKKILRNKYLKKICGEKTFLVQR